VRSALVRFVVAAAADPGVEEVALPSGSPATDIAANATGNAPSSSGTKWPRQGRQLGAAVALDPRSIRARAGRSSTHPHRGAHVHPRTVCLEKADKKGFSRSFRRAISPGESRGSVIATARDAAENETIRLLRLAHRQHHLRAWRLESQADLQSEHQSQAVGLLVVATDAPLAPKHPEVAKAITEGRAIALGDRATISRLLGSPVADVMNVESTSLATSLARVWAIRNAVGQCGAAAAEDG
jgi:predicted RNA-binding protein YlxR (DUF448 family)